MRKRIKTLNEFREAEMNSPAPVKTPKTAPTTTPTPTRHAPGPIRRDKPAVDPKPAATALDVVEKFIEILRDGEAPDNFNIKKIRSRYGKNS